MTTFQYFLAFPLEKTKNKKQKKTKKTKLVLEIRPIVFFYRNGNGSILLKLESETDQIFYNFLFGEIKFKLGIIIKLEKKTLKLMH